MVASGELNLMLIKGLIHFFIFVGYCNYLQLGFIIQETRECRFFIKTRARIILHTYTLQLLLCYMASTYSVCHTV